jgi:uncharacterized protein
MKALIAMTLICVLLPGIAPGQGSSAGPQNVAPLSFGETFMISSKVLEETRPINVYTPPAYAESADVELPVLYMLDGGMGEDFLHVAGLVQVSVGNGTMRPFILVGIENTARRRDLTGPTTNPEDKKLAPLAGGAPMFRRFLRTELMPAIKARYRTTQETAVIGESLAGLFVLETLFLEPDLFDTYIALDPSLWWSKGELVRRAVERMPNIGGNSLYFACGNDSEMVQLTRQLAESLAFHAPRNVDWRYEMLEEETHATLYHPAALRAFRYLFKPGKP